MKPSPKQFPLLVANLSDALPDLMKVNGQSVDGFELGPWFPPELIPTYRKKFPALPFLFHGGNMIAAFGENLGIETRLTEYLIYTDSAWISVHLMIWEAGDFDRLMHGERLPLPDPKKALSRLLRRLDALINLVSVPVLVENLEPLPFDGYDFWAQPEYICQVLEQSGCNFLLDIGHVRVSADRLGMEVETYLELLPLERVVEIHVRGPRRVNGRLLDAHRSMQAVDYRLLKAILSQQTPRVVTLEYNRERDQLSKQLDRLRQVLGMLVAKPERTTE
jgi:uncharacterized protein (UPF0276 family)